jgi:hypothetical protein
MAFEDLREILKNQFVQLGERITNSQVYIVLSERYENLNTIQQRLAKIISFIVLLGLFVYFPMDYFLISFENETAFEEKRKSIKDIIKSEREITALPDIPRPLPAEAFKSSVESQLKEMNLLPEQIKQVNVNFQPTGGMIPQNKMQYGIDITVNKINLKQLTNLGSKLQIIHPAVKIKDLIVTLNRDDARYLDADFHLVALNIPEYNPPEPPPPETKKKGKRPSKTETNEEQ